MIGEHILLAQALRMISQKRFPTADELRRRVQVIAPAQFVSWRLSDIIHEMRSLGIIRRRIGNKMCFFLTPSQVRYYASKYNLYSLLSNPRTPVVEINEEIDLKKWDRLLAAAKLLDNTPDIHTAFLILLVVNAVKKKSQRIDHDES